VAVNFALALKAEGAKVGLLDADIYGPSQPRMLGLVGRRPETLDGTEHVVVGHRHAGRP
jgi:ATP-binding protein involved in chromosome partitioning